MATDRLSNFKFGMCIIIKADKDWCGVGQPQVAFAIATFSSPVTAITTTITLRLLAFL